MAEQLERYDTVGIDCVAMNVNDLVCVGAEPLALLDYIALEDADPEMLGDLVTAAVNEGLRKAKDLAAERLGGLTQGMGLPPGLGF